MKLTRRNRVLLGVLGALFVVGLPGRLAWSMRASALDEAATVRQDTAGKVADLKKAREAKADEADLRAELDQLVRAMPATPDQQSLLDTLAGLAADTNVSWELLTSAVPQSSRTTVARDPGGEDDAATTATTAKAATEDTATATSSSGSATSSFAFDATVAGDEASVTAFLERVRDIERLVVIDKVQLTWNGTGAGDGGGVSARLSMRAFTWKGAARSTGSSTATTSPESSSTATTTVAP